MIRETERVPGEGMSLSRRERMDSAPRPGRIHQPVRESSALCRVGVGGGQGYGVRGQLCFFMETRYGHPSDMETERGPVALGREEKVLWESRDSTGSVRGCMVARQAPERFAQEFEGWSSLGRLQKVQI